VSVTSTIRAELVLDARAEAGESPWWSVSEQCLYWVDIHGQRVHRFDPRDGGDCEWTTPDLVTFVATHELGGLVVALRDRVCHVDLVEGDYREIAAPPLPVGGRLNDGAIDPRGRLLIGTMCAANAKDATGALFLIDFDRSCVQLLDGFRTVNGLAFSPDGRTMYVSDSHPDVRSVWACDYDVERGEVDGRRIFVDTRGLPGRPDGGCVDAEGCYWMAAVDGGSVLRFDVGGRLIGAIELPVDKPSKAAFGGSDLHCMFITSLRRNLATPGREQALAGGLFMARSAVGGIVLPDCRIALPKASG
jgi:sugar lactone lactonase YvrE